MKTTFDLPDLLVRKAKVLAAQQGRPLRDLVAEAIDEKLGRGQSGSRAVPGSREGHRETWEQWSSRLRLEPDGTWFNPAGIAEESFFATLEALRDRPHERRNPFDDHD